MVPVGVVEWMGEGGEWPEGINLACPVMCMPKNSPKWWCMRLARANWWMINFNLAQG